MQHLLLHHGHHLHVLLHSLLDGVESRFLWVLAGVCAGSWEREVLERGTRAWGGNRFPDSCAIRGRRSRRLLHLQHLLLHHVENEAGVGRGGRSGMEEYARSP